MGWELTGEGGNLEKRGRSRENGEGTGRKRGRKWEVKGGGNGRKEVGSGRRGVGNLEKNGKESRKWGRNWRKRGWKLGENDIFEIAGSRTNKEKAKNTSVEKRESVRNHQL